MTATEVIERTQEKMLMLGPVLGRLQSELLSPLLKRTFNILLRRGKLPKVPEKLTDAEYDIVYVSPLAKAQRAVQAKDTNTFMAVVGQMATMKQDVLDNINSDKMVDKLSKIYSIDPDMINDPDTVQAIREDRARAMQMEQRMQMMERAIAMGGQAQKGAKDGAEAKAVATR